MAYSAITNISSSFTNAVGKAGTTGTPQGLTRYFGGHSRTNHPYVNGYWQFFIAPPSKLFSAVASDAQKWFHSTAEGFTPPSRNLNKADLPGQGGVGSSFVTGQSLMRNFTVTHREYRDLPMMKLLELWTSIIIPYTGVSEFGGNDWQAKSYKGHAFAILTKPVADPTSMITAESVEEVYYFDGVWPENNPTDSLSQDISANDIVQYSVNYSFDGWPLTKSDAGVVDAAVAALNAYTYQATYDIYTSDLTSMSST